MVAILLGVGFVQLTQWGSFAQGDDQVGMGWTEDDYAGPPRLAQIGDPASSGSPSWPGRIDTAVTAYDINGDGTKELIVQSTDRNVYVFDATGERTLARLPSRYPAGWHIDNVLNAVSVERLRPDEAPSIVVANHAASITVWRFDAGASDAQSFAFDKVWERRLNDCFAKPGMDARPVLADLDGDGDIDILAQTEEQGLFALDTDGAVLWHHCWSGGNGDPVVADLNGDGRLKAIFASDSGFLSVFDAASGAPQWTFDAREPSYGVRPASVPVAPTVADLDGQLPLEVLFTARHAPSADPELVHDYHMAIFAVRGDVNTGKPELVWMRQPDWANPMSYTRLVVTDIDDDGRPDIFGMDWNTIGHRPGEWERLGAAHVFRLDADGNDVWVRSIDTWWSNKDILISDADGNGEMDVLVNGPRGPEDGFWRLSAETGQKEGFLSTSPWKVMRGAVPIDLRGDGTMQLVFPVTPLDGPADRGAVLVYDLEVPFTARAS